MTNKLTEQQISQIKKYIKDGYIVSRPNKEETLLILNYTNKCQFDQRWDEITMICRGLVVDNDWNIIARPFTKFFNLGELTEALPSEQFNVYEKLDGSLGILFNYNDKWIISTRGSFDSEQANVATVLLLLYDIQNLDKEYTYLTEIIYPTNKIVVDYGGEEKLVLLAKIHTQTGEEIDLPATYSKFEVAKRYTRFTNINSLKETQEDNKEGYVVKWPNGFRIKIKFDEYARLHKLISGVNERRIWDILQSGDNLDELLNCVPDEFYDFVKKTKEDLEHQFNTLQNNARKIYQDVRKLETRKEQALYIFKQTNGQTLSNIVFAMLDTKDHKSIIWKIIKPITKKQ